MSFFNFFQTKAASKQQVQIQIETPLVPSSFKIKDILMFAPAEPAPILECAKFGTFGTAVGCLSLRHPTVQKKKVSINEAKNDCILFQDVSSFIGYNVSQRHPCTGKVVTRICKSGKVSRVHVLPNGSLLEVRFGQQYPQSRRHFTSYNEWMHFLVSH
jgi:hypothetical protein